jgi:hypothetical protein
VTVPPRKRPVVDFAKPFPAPSEPPSKAPSKAPSNLPVIGWCGECGWYRAWTYRNHESVGRCGFTSAVATVTYSSVPPAECPLRRVRRGP